MGGVTAKLHSPLHEGFPDGGWDWKWMIPGDLLPKSQKAKDISTDFVLYEEEEKKNLRGTVLNGPVVRQLL